MSAPDPAAREREALADIAATRISRRVAWLLVLGFVLTLALSPALELGAARRGVSRLWSAPPPAPGGSLLEGWLGRIDALERGYDQRSALVRAIRPSAQDLLLRHTRHGNERVIAGRDGWLFFAPDVAALLEAGHDSGLTGELIGFRDLLAARGIVLLVVPVPAKPAIHPERLVPGLAAPLVSPKLRHTTERLAAAAVEVSDPTERLVRRARMDGAAYLERDTHWRPEAADDVARELAVVLRDLAPLPPGRDDLWVEEPVDVEGAGDTAALLDLPGDRLPPAQRVTVRTVRGQGGAAFGPQPAAPVLVLGDSFAAVYGEPDLGWGSGGGLVARLAYHLGLPVDAILRNAGGPTAARRELLDQLAHDPERLRTVRAVVLVFAAREL